MLGRGREPPKHAKAAALSIAERIRAARGVPQAVAKITRFHRTPTQCRRHFAYISRHGKLALETENGNLVMGLDEQRDLIDGWSKSFDHGKKSRNQMNYVVSATRGSSAEAVHKAARAFGQEAFGEHRYVFVMHTDKNHPHVHFAVRMQGQTKKLNPRLKDLHRWRELWANKAREQGIEMACSPRAARGVGRRGQKLPIYHLQRKGITPNVTKLAVKDAAEADTDTPWEQYCRARNSAERRAYKQAAVDLRAAAQTSLPAARAKLEAAADDLERFSASMPLAKTRRQQLREALKARAKQKSEDRER